LSTSSVATGRFSKAKILLVTIVTARETGRGLVIQMTGFHVVQNFWDISEPLFFLVEIQNLFFTLYWFAYDILVSKIKA
jgi:hypothetical protein